jgi:tRNA-intron lyase
MKKRDKKEEAEKYANIPKDKTKITSYNGGLNIYVKRKEDYENLWFGGCYGRGVLSRSQPVFEKRYNEESFRKKGGEEILFINPLYAEEWLSLSPEETIFLHLIEALEVEGWNLNDLWVKFCENQKKFPQMYSAYHYYRMQGFVVKYGINYGCDYVLYRKGPVFDHSVVGIIVADDSINMLDVVGSVRVLAGAKKKLIVCKVKVENKSTNSIFSSIENSEIEEIYLGRWIPEKSREKITK